MIEKFYKIAGKRSKQLIYAAGIAMIPAASLFVPGISMSAEAAQGTASSSSSWKASDDDALLFEMRSGKYRLGDSVRGYQTDRGVCADFADVIIALDLPIRLDKKSRRATGWIFTESQSLTVERDSNIVQKVNRSESLAPGEIYDTPEGWCVDTKTLSDWFDVTLQPDLSNALLLVKSETPLPFERALERKERAAKIRPKQSFDLSKLPQSSAPYKVWRTPSVDAVVAVGGLKDRRSGQRLDLRYELFASGEVGKASFDARLSSDTKGVPNSLRLRAYRTDPKGELLGPLQATHVAVGDVTTVSTPLVSQTSAGRGAFLTNRPVDRPENFDRTSFRGSLPEGWDAELYRNSQLLGFAEARGDGRYEFIDVPLLYGQNLFEIVLYGPQGQVRRETKSVPVGLDSIPPEKTYYWAGVQEAGADLINLDRLDQFDNPRQAGWRGGIGVERGLDTKTSIAASLYSLNVEGKRYNFAEGSLRRSIGPALAEVSAAATADGGTAFRGQVIGRLENTFFTAESIVAQGDFASDRIEPGVTGQHRISIDHIAKLGRTIVPFHIDAQYDTRNDGNDVLDITSRMSLNLRRISLTGEISYEKRFSDFGPDLPDRVEARLLANARIGPVRLRGEASYRVRPEKRFERVKITGEWDAGNRADWRAELGYDATLDRGRAGIGYIRRFDKFALTATAEAATDGSVAAGLNVAFSFGPDPRGNGVRFSSNKLANEGQALAIVFRDTNRDGIRQADEPLEKDVELTAGRSTALTATDKNGRAIIDNLEPFRPVLVGIDESSLSNPFLQPALPGVVVTPRPGVAMTVELPLVAAGEIEGTLMRSGGAALSGVGLELLDKQGRAIKRTQSEFDGFFLFESVPYGKYTLRIDALSAQAIGVTPYLQTQAELDEKQQVARLGAVVVSGDTSTVGNSEPGKMADPISGGQ